MGGERDQGHRATAWVLTRAHRLTPLCGEGLARLPGPPAIPRPACVGPIARTARAASNLRIYPPMAQTKAKPSNAGIPQVELRPISALVGYARNSRTHSPEQVAHSRPASSSGASTTHPRRRLEHGGRARPLHGDARTARGRRRGALPQRDADPRRHDPGDRLHRLERDAAARLHHRRQQTRPERGLGHRMLRVEMVDLQTEAFDLASPVSRRRRSTSP